MDIPADTPPDNSTENRRGTILVCAATAFELATCPEWPFAERLVSGVGGPETFHRLYRHPHTSQTPTPHSREVGEVSLIVNIGIAGAYPETGIAIGDVVLVDGEVWGDLGMDLPTEPGFLPLAETDFGREFYAGPLPTVIPELLPQRAPAEADFTVHRARGCTVNSCTGTRVVGMRRAQQFGVGCETMEGAAVAQVARDWGVPLCEIRAISNIAADRDMRPENIRRALENLRQYLETCGPVFAVFSE